MRRALPVAAIVLSLVSFSVRSSFAQVSSPGPTGGTSALQTRTEVVVATSPSTTGLRSGAGWSFFSRRTIAVLRSAPMLALWWRRGLL